MLLWGVYSVAYEHEDVRPGSILHCLRVVRYSDDPCSEADPPFLIHLHLRLHLTYGCTNPTRSETKLIDTLSA